MVFDLLVHGPVVGRACLRPGPGPQSCHRQRVGAAFDGGTTILLVEQNVERALAISDRAYILDQGRIVHQGDAQALLADRDIQERYCAV